MTNEAMTFGDALVALKDGGRVAREGWNGKGMWITHVAADVGHNEYGEDEYIVRDYIAMKTVDNQIVPWVASQTDLLADDWVLVTD